LSDTNPYQSPQTEISAEDNRQGILTNSMVLYLQEAAPWLRFIGILGYIGCGISVGTGLVMMVTMIVGLSSFGIDKTWPMTTSGMFGFVYLIFGALMAFPARFTYNFGARIRNFIKGSAEQELELAFKNNKSLWKYLGILCIVNLALIPVGIVILIILTVLGLI
jgi:hypothetical protein